MRVYVMCVYEMCVYVMYYIRDCLLNMFPKRNHSWETIPVSQGSVHVANKIHSLSVQFTLGLSFFKQKHEEK